MLNSKRNIVKFVYDSFVVELTAYNDITYLDDSLHLRTRIVGL